MMAVATLFNITKNSMISHRVEIAKSFAERSQGLLGRASLLDDNGLWIHKCGSIHTCFMKFAIDVLYVNKKLQVVKVQRNIKPWRFSWGGFSANSCFEFQAGSLTKDLDIGDFLRVSA